MSKFMDATNCFHCGNEIIKKEEIQFDYTIDESEKLLNGIEEGSRRTAEIVKGLRNFSRLDEEEMKSANLNEGIESTLLLLRNKLSHKNIEVIKSLSTIAAIDLVMAMPVSWLPLVGDPLCAVAGWLKMPFWPCLGYMAIGKLVRYITMTAGFFWALEHWPGR